MTRSAAAEPSVDAQLSDDPWPVAAKRLLTEREQSLYLSLLSMYPSHRLFIQVALSQLVDVPEDHPDRQSIRNRFSRLVADFVLCRADLSIVAVIELDDRSHRRADRQDADARKNKVLADAGIRLVRIPAGRVPSEDALRALIDADKRDKRGPTEEVVLTLAEDPYSEESSYDSEDESSTVSRDFKRIGLKVAGVAILLFGGWFIFSYVLPAAIKVAMQSLATPHVRTVPAPTKPIQVIPRQILTSPAIAESSTEELSLQKQQALQAANALQKKKDLAWAAFYAAPASCEHPGDWSAQVECGNQYMRAKKVFEHKWETEHSSSQESGAEGTVNNRSVAGRPK